MKSGDILNFGDLVFAQFHLFQVDQPVQLFDFRNQVVLQVEFLEQLAGVDAFDFGDQIGFQINLPQICQNLQSFHRGQLHVGQIQTLNGQFPVVVVDAFQSFGLHDFAVLLQKLVSDEVRCLFLHFELVEFLLGQVVEPHQFRKFFGYVDHGVNHLIFFKGVEEDVYFFESAFAEFQDVEGLWAGDLIMTDVKVLKRQGGKSTQCGYLIVADVEFFYLIQFLELNEVREVVVGEHKHFEVCEF